VYLYLSMQDVDLNFSPWYGNLRGILRLLAPYVQVLERGWLQWLDYQQIEHSVMMMSVYSNFSASPCLNLTLQFIIVDLHLCKMLYLL
jgi:hypothetical protein